MLHVAQLQTFISLYYKAPYSRTTHTRDPQLNSIIIQNIGKEGKETMDRRKRQFKKPDKQAKENRNSKGWNR